MQLSFHLCRWNDIGRDGLGTVVAIYRTCIGADSFDEKVQNSFQFASSQYGH